MHLKVKVYPGSKKESVHKKDLDKLEIYVREKAEQGKVNKRVTEVLKNLYSDPSIKMVAGHRSQNKIFEINS